MALYSAHASDAADIARRAKQIAQRNPGHPASAALLAAEEEGAAVRAVERADEAGREAARFHLRAMQLRAANLDLDHAAACELARLFLGDPSHGGVRS